MKLSRSHPINIFEKISKYLILLLFPIVRALWNVFVTNGGFYTWLLGAWRDIIIVVIILLLGFYNWWEYRFCFDKDGIYFFKGIIFKQQRYLAYDKITLVSVEQTWYLRPIKTARLYVDTDSGSTRNYDFTITVNKDTAQRILLKFKEYLSDDAQIKQSYTPTNFYVALFSLVSSSSLTGVLYLAAFVSQAGNVIGNRMEQMIVEGVTKLSARLAFGLPPAAAYLAYLIMLFWFIDFVAKLLRHLKFKVYRKGNNLSVNTGVITRRTFSINTQRINYITLRQSLITRVLGFTSAFVHCTGYGKDRKELSVILPTGEQDNIISNLNILLPEIPVLKMKLKPKKRAFFRFMWPPLAVIGVILAARFTLGIFFTSIPSILNLMAFGLCIPVVWWLFVKVYGFFFSGISVDDKVLTLKHTKGFRILTVSIPKEKIVDIRLRQTILQVRSRGVDVCVYPYGESRFSRQVVMGLDIDEVLELFNSHDGGYVSGDNKI